MNRERLLTLIEELGNQPVLLVLDERQQDVQLHPVAGEPSAPDAPPPVVGFENVVIEAPARLRAQQLRHIGDGLIEARVRNDPHPEDPNPKTHLHYFDASHIVRLVTASLVEL